MSLGLFSVLVVIALLLTLIAWRLIAGQSSFNSFWRALWSKTLRVKGLLLTIAGLIFLAVGTYFSKLAYEDYAKERLRNKWQAKRALVETELRSRGIVRPDYSFTIFATPEQKADIDRQQSELFKNCIAQSTEIVSILNEKAGTPRIGKDNDAMLTHTICRDLAL